MNRNTIILFFILSIVLYVVVVITTLNSQNQKDYFYIDAAKDFCKNNPSEELC